MAHILRHGDDWLCFAEQECHLIKDKVDDPHHLDQKPGFKIKDKGAASCGDTSKLTFDECEKAREALDWKAAAVAKTNETSLPTGCYRQQKVKYRFNHSESSYLWHFNEATTEQSDSNSEPVCKGNVKLNYLCAYLFIHI